MSDADAIRNFADQAGKMTTLIHSFIAFSADRLDRIQQERLSTIYAMLDNAADDLRSLADEIER